MIVAKNISKNFGLCKALNNINFCISRGEVVALLGPNGAGKTTLLRLLTGFLAPDSGEISISGHDIITSRTEALKNIGYIPENCPLYGEMSVYEFLRFSAQIHGLSCQEFKTAAEEVIARLSLENVINQKIETLSKGFKHRTGLAACLIYRPKVLILDEPTEGLDPNQKFEFRELIKEYGNKNIVLFSTHIMEEVEAMADRVILLNHGKLVRDTSPKELKNMTEDNDLQTAFRTITTDR